MSTVHSIPHHILHLYISFRDLYVQVDQCAGLYLNTGNKVQYWKHTTFIYNYFFIVSLNHELVALVLLLVYLFALTGSMEPFFII
jgi:hypothetical protein